MLTPVLVRPKNISLIVAIVLALLTGFLTWQFLATEHRTTAERGASRNVIVAAQDIPARVRITPAMLTVATRQKASSEPDALVEPAQAIGGYSLISIPAGSTITASKIASTQSAALATVLKPGMRAVSIGLDRVKGVSGLIVPGDRVDVIAVPSHYAGEAPVARTILRGVLVLALGTRLETATNATSPDQNVSTATLGVTPQQADLLASADVNATLRLALRSPEEPLNSLPVERLVIPGAEAQPVATLPAPRSASEHAPVVARQVRTVTVPSVIPVIDGAADYKGP